MSIKKLKKELVEWQDEFARFTTGLDESSLSASEMDFVQEDIEEYREIISLYSAAVLFAELFW